MIQDWEDAQDAKSEAIQTAIKQAREDVKTSVMFDLPDAARDTVEKFLMTERKDYEK